tara:strand:- start:55 stop:321 length:267 start_codon:yes stop_codon:yes gene_type:complete
MTIFNFNRGVSPPPTGGMKMFDIITTIALNNAPHNQLKQKIKSIQKNGIVDKFDIHFLWDCLDNAKIQPELLHNINLEMNTYQEDIIK